MSRILALLAIILLPLCATAATAAETVRIGGNGTVSALMVRLGERYRDAHPGAGVDVVMPPMGSGGGLRALSAGKLDIAVGIRQLKPDEQATPNIGASRLLGRTPFVLVTSLKEPPPLDLPALAAIYTGAVQRWPDGTPIRLILRSRAEGVTLFMRSLSPELSAALDAAFSRKGMVTSDNDLDTTDLAARNPGSLAPSTVLLSRLENRNLTMLPLSGLAADNPAAHMALWLTLAAAPSPETLAFLAFLDAPATRAWLAEAGVDAAAQ